MTDYVNRQSLLGLLIAQVVAILLYISSLPLWLLALAVIVFIWRVQIYRGQWSFPGRTVRGALILISMVAVIAHYPQWYSLEPMVSVLIVAFLLKLLEVEYQRDAIVLIFVGYFVTACAYLFDQTLLTTFAGLFALWLLTACLLVLSASQTHYISRRTTRIVSVLLIQAVPLMLLMLFIFPRIGALWSVPLQSDSAVTGVSDSMSPGDFSQLGQNRSVAFRVNFDNDQVPAPIDRYWRGLVFTEFNGRRWQRPEKALLKQARPSSDEIYQINDQAALGYEVILEPTNTQWVYAMPLANIVGRSAKRLATNELWLREPITQRIQYRVESTSNYHIAETEENLRQSLLLPVGFNPKTMSIAREWRNQVNSHRAYINRVLQYYQDNFIYTLSPPKLGSNTVDEFLFSTQRGFCEHFSSSFVVLMRAVGIPARVVVGYQGGKWSQEDKFLTIRQYDAHAWAEVWLDNHWVRMDPTAAVAPNRIEQGLFGALSEQDQQLVERLPLSSFSWVNRLVAQLETMNYRWQRWVLSYDQEKQAELLQKILGEVTTARLAALLIAPAAVILLFSSLLLLKQSTTPISREQKIYHYLCKRLQTLGVDTEPTETIAQLCLRAVSQRKDKEKELIKIDKIMERFLYQRQQALSKQEYKQVLKIIGQL